MKKLRKNTGFTLIECVVAMAVLAVMTLGLLMILNVTVKQRNLNMKIENDVDGQVEKLVQEDSVTDVSVANPKIDFGGGIEISGGKKVYHDDPDAEFQIGALEYDIGSVPSAPPPSNPGSPAPADPNDGLGQAYNAENFKVYGAADVSGKITITESKTPADGGYKVTWNVRFTTTSGSREKSVKVVLPRGSCEIKCPTSTNCEAVAYMDNSTVRIQPANGSGWGSEKYDNTSVPTEINITFYISTSDYDTYNCLHYYLTGNEAFKNDSTNSISVDINT